MHTRRRFLRNGLCVSGALLVGCGDDDATATDAGPPLDDDAGPPGVDAGPPDAGAPSCPDALAGATKVADLRFLREGDAPFHRLLGAGWDARRYTDLRELDTDPDLVVPNDRFYVRTGYPDLIDPTLPWRITVSGLVDADVELGPSDLEPLVVDRGIQVLECSGNGDFSGFGLLSAARWAGAPLMDVLALASVRPEATRVLVSGFDGHSRPSAGGHSTPGASWIFTFDELERAGAILATRMNGAPLPNDNGFPVRLLVPNWYGCCNVKWVDEIVLVDEEHEATAQMWEFATRTHQTRAHRLARDYAPATMDQAAMPVRVEQWRRADGRLAYRIVGILWGGYSVTDALVIRLGGADFVPVDVCPPHRDNSAFTRWEHVWEPPAPGEYEIAMRIDDPGVPTRRLDSGFYVREVSITEV